jgi:hypothetical protein
LGDGVGCRINDWSGENGDHWGENKDHSGCRDEDQSSRWELNPLPYVTIP